MKTTIYLVRHCESEGNACRRSQAKFDGIVTRKGLLQSEALAKRFEDVPVTAIYSSDSYRCRVTAAPLAAAKGLRVQYRMLLREYTIGIWEAYSIGYTARRFPERYARWLSTPYDHDIPGADPFWLAADRGYAIIQRMAEENPGGVVVAVSHSCTMNCAMTRILGQPISYYASVKSGDNTAVTKLEVDENGHIELAYMSDDSHLPEELRRHNYTGRSAATNFDFEPVTLPGDAGRLDEVCRAADSEFPTWFKKEEMYAEVKRSAAEKAGYAVFPMLLDRTCGLVTVHSDAALPEDHGMLGVLYVSDDLRDRGYTEQAFGEAIDVMRRNGKRYLVAKDCGEHHLQLLKNRFCFEPMPGNDQLMRMAITVPGCNDPVY